jgi:hypothetical protein
MIPPVKLSPNMSYEKLEVPCCEVADTRTNDLREVVLQWQEVKAATECFNMAVLVFTDLN